MVFAVVDTPRTELGDQTRLSDFNDPDFSTANSIESPTKQGENPLLRQIRGMRSSTSGGRTPRSRLPLADRRNPGGKGEFTPLLKSATKNSFMRSNGSGKENLNAELETPAGLKAGYGRENSPALPFNSSVIVEEAEDYTGSSAGQDDVQASIVAPPISSSSALSTPMVIAQRQNDGTLDHQGNIATLREQEAKLVHIDKENFGLKLKIHFLELALQKNGKEFNEQAIKENAELKVDKITLQRDMKHYRKLLSQAEKDLETYRQQLHDYAEKVKRRHMDEDMKEEHDRLRQSVADGEAKIEELQEKVDTIQALEEQVEKLQDDCSDLEAELRQKERELEEKDSNLQELRESGPSDENSKEQLEEKMRLLEEKDEDIEALQDALRNAEESAEQKIQEKQKLLEEKDDELQDLEDQLKDQSLVRSKDDEKQKLLNEKDNEIRELKNKLEAAVSQKSVLEERDHEIEDQKQEIQTLQDELNSMDEVKRKADELQEKLEVAEAEHSAESRKKNRTIEEKEFEIRTLEQKLESAEGRDSETEKLQDQIADLEAEIRENSRLVDAKEDEIANLNDTIRETKQQADDEANEYEDRIQVLESQQLRHVAELQELRDNKITVSEGRDQALKNSQARIQELENQLSIDKEQEGHLQIDINKLHDQISRLQSNVKDKDATFAKEQQKWIDDRRSLESQKSNAEERAAGLQRTVAGLQDSEGTSSSRETQLQKALESEEDRHRLEENRLQKQLLATTENFEEQRKKLKQTEESIQNIQTELSELKVQHSSCKEQEASLRDTIQSLEDEIEVLQFGADEDADQARIDIDTAKQEAETLQKRVKELQTDLSTALYQAGQGKELDPKASQYQTDPSPLQQKLQDLQGQLHKANKEKLMLEDELAVTKADLDTRQSNVFQLESSRDTAQQQSRELRKQLQELQREHERKSQSQVLSYEQDIQNLEQDLMDANAKHAELESKSHAAEQQISRLQSKIKSLDAELANARAQRASGDTSVAERKELHEMLKDAKLEAEDLTLQVKDRDGRLSALASKETSLREQMKRLREERTTQAARADALAKDLDSLQHKHDMLSEAMEALEAKQRHVRFPGSSSVVVAAPAQDDDPRHDAAARDHLMQAQKRHAAELRGLGRQIEYLAARCRREGRFRADLGYVKQYFTRQVEMHGRCTRADLRLVRAMGIPVDEVVAKEEAAAALEGGRVAMRDGHGARPTLRCVGRVVVACVRMQRGAERWAAVRKGHDALVRKLRDMQGGRACEREGDKAKAKRTAAARRTEF